MNITDQRVITLSLLLALITAMQVSNQAINTEVPKDHETMPNLGLLWMEFALIHNTIFFVPFRRI